MFKYHSFFLLLLYLSSYPIVAAEQDAIKRLEMDLIGLHNPLGLSASLKGYQRHIYNRSDNILWDGLYYQYGAQGSVTPAYGKMGLHLEWMPIALVQLRIQSERYFFSGSFGSLLEFPANNSPFDDDDIEAREGEERADTGSRNMFSLILRAKLATFVIRNVTELARYEFPGNGPYFLEREYELLMAKQEELFANQLYLFYDGSDAAGTLYLGPYHDYVRLAESGQHRERVGLTVFREYQKALGSFQSPRWYLQMGRYLQEPNRDGEYYLVAGVGADFNF